MAMLSQGASLRELVTGLNALGVGPRDLITILQTIKAAGALQADIETRQEDDALNTLTPTNAYTAQLYANNTPNQFAAKNATEAEIYEKARELEGQFLSTMIEPLFSEGQDSGLFGGGAGNDITRTLMIQEYSQIFSQSGGIGLADDIAKSMLALQEVE